jgi:hypothetical protein
MPSGDCRTLASDVTVASLPIRKAVACLESSTLYIGRVNRRCGSVHTWIHVNTQTNVLPHDQAYATAADSPARKWYAHIPSTHDYVDQVEDGCRHCCSLRPLSSSAAFRLPCPLVTKRAICSSSLQLPLLSARPSYAAPCMFALKTARFLSVNESLLLRSLGEPRATAASAFAAGRDPRDRRMQSGHLQALRSILRANPPQSRAAKPSSCKGSNPPGKRSEVLIVTRKSLQQHYSRSNHIGRQTTARVLLGPVRYCQSNNFYL